MTHPQAPKWLDPPTPHQRYLSAVAASELVGTSGGYTLAMTPGHSLHPWCQHFALREEWVSLRSVR